MLFNTDTQRYCAARRSTPTLATMKYKSLLVAFVLLAPIGAHACRCLPQGTVEQEIKVSSKVFLGRVTSIEGGTPEIGNSVVDMILDWLSKFYGERTPSTDRYIPYKRVTFSVLETFKGAPTKEVQLATGIGGGDCGYSFDLGQEYVVYAYGEPSKLTANICSLTGPASDPTSGLKALRKGI